jgi:hypothetical protein
MMMMIEQLEGNHWSEFFQGNRTSKDKVFVDMSSSFKLQVLVSSFVSLAQSPA